MPSSVSSIETVTALTACHAATCRSLPEPKTPFNMPLTAHSATCPPCGGVNGRPLTATGTAPGLGGNGAAIHPQGFCDVPRLDGDEKMSMALDFIGVYA